MGIFYAMKKADKKFVSRSGIKLEAAIKQFNIPVENAICADLGSNVGGFTECLLEYGAKKIYAIDTGYGVLDYKLRTDPRVIVMERTNALHVTLPELCDIVTIDIGWTKQQLILPVAKKLIKPQGKIISLVKPHYEADRKLLKAGTLSAQKADVIFNEIISHLSEWNLELIGQIISPIKGKAGNTEYLIYLKNKDT